jgi:hypothetical protein
MNDEELQQQQGSKAGTALAGSGGAASPTGQQQAGSGFTNLQKYLEANQGQGGGLANVITTEGQKQVDTGVKAANDASQAWASGVISDANNAAQPTVDLYSKGAQAYNNTSGSDSSYLDNADINAAKSAGNYTGLTDVTKAAGYNDLDKAYQNVKNQATGYANDYNAQKGLLQKTYGYGSGFGALDTFLARQDGKQQLQNWSAGVNPGSAQPYIDQASKGIQAAQQSVTDAQKGFGDAAAYLKKRQADALPKPAAGASTSTTSTHNGTSTSITAGAGPVGGIATRGVEVTEKLAPEDEKMDYRGQTQTTYGR